jgi:hypothetical protein
MTGASPPPSSAVVTQLTAALVSRVQGALSPVPLAQLGELRVTAAMAT